MVMVETIPQQAPHPDLHRPLTTSDSVPNASVFDPATLPRSHDEDETRHNRGRMMAALHHSRIDRQQKHEEAHFAQTLDTFRKKGVVE